MKTLDICTTYDKASYDETCAFATAHYARTLGFSLTSYPDCFMSIRGDDGVQGCIGLNTTVTSSLFNKDVGFTRSVPQHIRCGEQSVLAVDGVCYGTPLLIAAMAWYAQSIGVSRVVYAGIEVSCRVVEKLGFPVQMLGPTDLDLLPEESRENYRYWHTSYNPVTCVLDTRKASSIFPDTLKRFARRVACGGRLNAYASSLRAFEAPHIIAA